MGYAKHACYPALGPVLGLGIRIHHTAKQQHSSNQVYWNGSVHLSQIFRHRPNCTKRMKKKWLIWDDGMGQETRMLPVLLLEGMQTDTTVTKRGFLQKKKLAPHILGIWVGKAKVETSHFSSILGLRKPFLPFLAAMPRTVTLMAPLR